MNYDIDTEYEAVPENTNFEIAENVPRGYKFAFFTFFISSGYCLASCIT